jgi:hypothetical protein
MLAHRLRMTHCLLGLAFLWCPCPAPAGEAQASGSRPSSLKGLPGFHVVVERLAPKVEEAGLTQQDLQSDVQSRLEEAGVPLSKDAPVLLYANVAVVCSDLVCAYNVNLEVQQAVHPVLHPEAGPLLATTWNTGTTGLTDRRLRSIRDRVGEQVDQFLKAYRTANPK